MSLRAILLRSRIQAANAQLEQLRTAAQAFETRRAELETAIHEAETRTDLTDEDRQTLETEVENFDNEVNENAQASENLQNSIDEMEAELKEIEAANEPQPAPAANDQPAPEATITDTNTGEERTRIMPNRRFRDMSIEQRTAFVQRDEVKNFLQEVRRLAGIAVTEHRAVTGGALTIPEVMLPLIKTTTETYSKLLKHVNRVTLNGTGRQVIMGEIPEAVWVECCANLNELDLTFTEKEIDCYKIAGFIPVCNSTLEDSDIDLADEVLEAIGQSIGYAVDKAIAFGTGTKMPVGFIPNLAAANKVSLNGKTGAGLFAAILKGMKNVKHASGDLFWIMTEGTKMELMAEAVSINAAGAIVSGVSNTMPVIGGAIETLDFVKEGEIYGGYGARYLLGERKGIQLRVSEEYKFVEDQTVFKGTARYDGKPVFQDAFIGFGLSAAATAAIDTNHPFASDTANSGE